MGEKKVNCFWFRRDLRLHDNKGLYEALNADHPVLGVFIFDTNILDELEDKEDARVEFIYDEIASIKSQLQQKGSDLKVYYGKPIDIWGKVSKEYLLNAIYTNRDYEPYAKERDGRVEEWANKKDINFHTFKDQVILEAGEVLKDDGDPYVVYTPFKKKWYATVSGGASGNDSMKQSNYLQSFPSEKHLDKFLKQEKEELLSLESMGFKRTDIEIPSREVKRSIIKDYDETRNYPAIEKGTSRLGVHYRFGTISVRDKARKALDLNKTYLNELIWREFYSHILAHFPRVVDEPFYRKYRFIEWRNDEKEFDRWCKGKTGYPIVDAGMRQLNQTGYMHNRVRMITASFLTKHLLIDWRWGEAYFAKKLLDYELASNNGGWQWAAGTGTDAAPYFRIFNPWRQTERFDPEKKYIQEWVPEHETEEYPEPMVEHKSARERCLKVYKSALEEAD
jgi:deoxyribodipyrimidine photo-lyase